jgi:Ras-related protein Rab-8A
VATLNQLQKHALALSHFITALIKMTTTSSQYDHLIKLVLIGDVGVGKTSLLRRFADATFSTTTVVATVGIDFKIRCVELDGKRIKLQIWNSRAERNTAMSMALYRGAMGILVVYDVTDEVSFLRLPGLMQDVGQHANPKSCKILLGNKCDMVEKRVVELSRAQHLANSLRMDVLDTSAKDNVNVDDAFFTVVRHIMQTCA